MELNNNSLISRLSDRYSDMMTANGGNLKSCKPAIAAAYIIGATATLHRICLLIDGSSKVENGLPPEKARKLLELIKLTEGIV